MVCNSLNTPPLACENFVDFETDKVDPSTSVWGVILYTLLIMGALFVLVLVVFKRYLKRRMSGHISSQVNQMVSQYIAFYDKNESGIKTTEEAM